MTGKVKLMEMTTYLKKEKYPLKDPLPIFEIIEQKNYKKNGMQYKRSNDENI